MTVVHPGLTRTEKTPAVIAARADAQGLSRSGGRAADGLRQRSVRSLSTPDEIADVVAFLASPRVVAINGDAIAAGGGIPGPIYY